VSADTRTKKNVNSLQTRLECFAGKSWRSDISHPHLPFIMWCSICHEVQTQQAATEGISNKYWHKRNWHFGLCCVAYHASLEFGKAETFTDWTR